MRTSCSGCRVLRKGCTDDCTIRPCLHWIKSPDSQANATLFLAKFYGRAGLLNLLNAAPHHLRPGIFQSLLYEACGRVVDPVYGSAGLLYSGQWQHCQLAVDAVLNGLPITQSPPSDGGVKQLYDIRHVPTSQPPGFHRARFTRRPRARPFFDSDQLSIINTRGGYEEEEEEEEEESVFSGETTEESVAEQAGGESESEVRLELTLGFSQMVHV